MIISKKELNNLIEEKVYQARLEELRKWQFGEIFTRLKVVEKRVNKIEKKMRKQYEKTDDQ